MRKKVLFILPYPLHLAPSQRFRVELFLPYLHEKGIYYTLAPFMNEATWNVLYKNGSSIQKTIGILKGFLKRIKHVFIDALAHDYIFVHREASPIGPPIFEFILSKIYRKKLIYDFDDAIWIPNTSAENKIAAALKCFWKVPSICKWSYKISAGNSYLCNFAAIYNKHVNLVPTCVDTDKMHNKEKVHHNGRPVIGWTGSHSTLFYLNQIMPVLQELDNEYEFTFILIANKDPQLNLKHYRFIKWQESTEIEDLLKLDIGLMPLQEDAWSEGKCGFKLIQYLSLGIPAIASPVGVNNEIVINEKNGFIARTKADWKTALITLINNSNLRATMGQHGRQLVISRYSIKAQLNNFTQLFE
jgi:glycosyltransferase involved in cell wall biosynthesis